MNPTPKADNLERRLHVMRKVAHRWHRLCDESLQAHKEISGEQLSTLKKLREELDKAKTLIKTLSTLPMRDAAKVAELKETLKGRDYALHRAQTANKVLTEALQGLTEGMPEYEASPVYVADF